MNNFTYGGKTYAVDSEGFLLDFNQWEQGFAEGLAPQLGISEGLKKEHWEVLYFIRESYINFGECPQVYKTCRKFSFRMKDLKKLFPSGYLRGACKLAGLTYKEAYYSDIRLPESFTELALDAGEELQKETKETFYDKTYTIDVRGFLINPEEWDRQFALCKAQEMKIPGGLTKKHWDLIEFLRRSFEQGHLVPTVYETCEAQDIDIDELEQLFPDGYHRGAVKISGLRVR